MSPSARQRNPRRLYGRATTPAAGTGRGVADLQRGWWVLGIAGTLVGALGFQALPPARRLALLESVNARQDSVNASQDSVLAAHQRVEREALDSINRQLGQLLAGQCAKERDRMARLLYACGRWDK